MREVWRVLYEFGADVVVNGHDHIYERFAPQRRDGAADPAAGIREFVVGTGVEGLSKFKKIRANSAFIVPLFYFLSPAKRLHGRGPAVVCVNKYFVILFK